MMKARLFSLLSLIVVGLVAVIAITETAKSKSRPATPRTTTALARKSWINVQPGRQLQAAYAGQESLSAPLKTGAATPLTLATADFDRDGAPDLLSGYANGDRGIITVQRGNIDAFAPRDTATFKDIQEGRTPNSFLKETNTFAVPERPDFLIVSDLDGDGNADVLMAARGGGLYALAGNGAGDFSAPQRAELPGGVTALAVGHFFGGTGGGLDVAVAVSGTKSPSVLIFNAGAGVLSGEPQAFSLSAEASSLAFGKLDGDSFTDIAATVGTEVDIIHGQATGAKPSASQVEHINLSFGAQSLRLGEFVWDRDNLPEMAVVADDGTIHLMQRTDLDTRPYTQAEEDEIYARREHDDYATADTQQSKAATWQPGKESVWTVSKQLDATTSASNAARAQSPVISGFFTYQQTEDIVSLDVSRNQLDIARRVGDESNGAEPNSVAIDVANAPVAVLAMPRKVNGERDLVMLNEGASAPTTVVLAPLATITVDRTDDTTGASACTAAANDCSLRGAITFSETNLGTQINLGSTTYNVTIAGSGENSNATGDIDSRLGSGTSLVGTGAATTTIQSSAGDRIFDLGSASGYTFSMSGLTMTGGNLSSGSGGAFIAGGTNTTTTVTSCNFTTNTSASNGGAISHSTNAQPHFLNMTSVTFTNNTATGGVGGGLSFNGGTNGTTAGTLTTTSCTFTGNTASANQGGGLNVTSVNTPLNTFNVTKSVFLNNHALGATGFGGGIDKGNGNLNLSFSRIFGNTVGGGLGTGLHHLSGANGTATATNNWWGCSGDPTTAPTGCDTVTRGGGAETLPTVNPRIVLTNTSSPNPILYGQGTTFTADFLHDSSGGSIALSNITVLIGLPITFNNATHGTISSAQTTIQANGTATVSYQTGTAANTAGTGTVDAIVDGGTTTGTITINKGSTTTTVNSDNPDPSVTGQTITVNYTINIVSPASGLITGNVQVSDGTTTNTCAVTTNTNTTSGNCTLTIQSAGAKSLTASYQGDTNLLTSTSSPATAHTVNKADTTTTITNSVGLGTATVTGQSYAVNWSTTVDAPGSVGVALTGNVNVSDGTGGTCSAAVSAGTCNITSTTTGTKTLTATYVGDANYNASPTSTGVSHTVNPANTTTTITNSVGLGTATVVGQAYAVNWSVAVNAPGSLGAALTGNVNVSDGTGGTCSAAVSAGTCNITSTTTGTKTITATYVGDSNYNASPASSGVSHTVNKASTTTTITNGASLGTASNVNVAYAVNWSVAVNAPGALGAALTGNVNVSDGTGGTCSAAVSAGTCNLTSTTAGTKTITATYVGDANYNASPASSGVSHTVNNTIFINDITIAEGNVGSVTATITVTLGAPATAPNVGFTVSTADNTATAPADYTAIAGSAQTISTGQSTKTINITIPSDTVREPNKSFFVNLTSPTNAVITDTQGVVTIINDDPTLGDFDGDGKTDVALWQNTVANWKILQSSTGTIFTQINWGSSALGDIAVPGDYDGDGRTDIAVWRPSEGNWYIIKSNNGSPNPTNQSWGTSTDKPVPGDYDGDGKTDLAVFRPSEGNWYILRSSDGGTTITNWGASTDLLVRGDYDGDGKTDIAVYRPSEGNWYIRNSSSGTVTLKNWGGGSDKPVPGDYDGDGKTDLAIFRADGTWNILNSGDNTVRVKSWGTTSDALVPGNYDGDNKTDIAVFRPAENNWYIINSATNTLSIKNAGSDPAVPAPATYIP